MVVVMRIPSSDSPVHVCLSGHCPLVCQKALSSHLALCCPMLRLSHLSLPAASTFFHHTSVCVCVCVPWRSPLVVWLKVLTSQPDSCCRMFLLSLWELAFGQLNFDHTCLCLCICLGFVFSSEQDTVITSRSCCFELLLRLLLKYACSCGDIQRTICLSKPIKQSTHAECIKHTTQTRWSPSEKTVIASSNQSNNRTYWNISLSLSTYVYIWNLRVDPKLCFFVIEGCGKTMGNPRNAEYWQLGQAI